VAQNKGDPFLGAEVGQPLPGEDALHGHDPVVTVGSNDAQEVCWRRTQVFVDYDGARLIKDADVQGTGM